MVGPTQGNVITSLSLRASGQRSLSAFPRHLPPGAGTRHLKRRLQLGQLCRDAVPTLPMSGGGGKRLAVGNSFRLSAAGILKPMADGRNADPRMADAPVAVTRHLKRRLQLGQLCRDAVPPLPETGGGDVIASLPRCIRCQPANWPTGQLTFTSLVHRSTGQPTKAYAFVG